MKINMWIFGFLSMCLYGLILSPAYAQDRRLDMNHPESWEEIVGRVESFNLDTSILTIKAYSGEERTSYQEVTILITKEAKIVKNGQGFALKDLKTGDEISIRYIVTANGQKEAYYLWVK